MTPNQQAALERLVGRALTDAEVAAIEPHLPHRNDVAIAEILSVGRTQLRNVDVGYGTIVAVMRPRGGAFLRALEALSAVNDDVFFGMKSVERGVFNPGLPAGQAQLDMLKPLLQHEFDVELENVKALGHGPNPLQFNAVSDALNKAEGRMTL